ncbi:MAG: TonB family protein [Dysgonamonadaceae bacterium]
METILIYIAKVNIALAVFYLLYLLLLRKDTFIRLRRYYFLSAIIFSLAYPLFTVASLGSFIDLSSTPIKTETSVIIGELSMEGMIVSDVEDTAVPISWTVIIKWTLLSGSLFFAIRFLWQFSSIILIKSRSEKKSLFGQPIYDLRDEITPFSFFNWIFIHTKKHSEEELKQILLHEQTHVQQWHSLDVMLVEMLRILFWWNPIVWLMKRDVAINLEYLADNAVLQRGVETSDYQYHLLQLTYHDTAVQIVNNFNVPQLKQRIIMMNTNKSPLRKLVKYLSVLPLALLLITANSVYAQTNKMQKEIMPPQEPQKKESKNNEIFVVVEQQPEFPGGTSGLMKFLGANIEYPKEAQEKRIEGRVIMSFVVEKDGSVTDVQVARGQDPLLDAEALRVIPLMPNWKPGQQRGENVRVRYTLPIVFRLPEIETKGTIVAGHQQHDNKEQTEIMVFGFGSMSDKPIQSLAEKFGDGSPLIIVDDVKMEKRFDLNQIKPEEIESISVLKNESAISKYGEEGKNGVIEIITKPLYKVKNAIREKLGESPDDIFVVVEEQPKFPGGMQALMSYLGENIQYPEEAHKNRIEGRVITNFVVNEDGSLSDVSVVRSIDPLLDAEAIRVISAMPDWKPGKQRGEKVKVRFTLPIVFRLKADEEVESEAIQKLKEKSPVAVDEMKDDASNKAFYEFIGKTVKYPVIAQENGIMGLTKATYDVNAQGEVSNVKTTEGVDPSLDAELIRVIKLMPKDIALMKSGGKAASNVEISAHFRLQDESTVPPPPVKSDVVVVGYGKPVKNK